MKCTNCGEPCEGGGNMCGKCFQLLLKWKGHKPDTAGLYGNLDHSARDKFDARNKDEREH